VMSGRRRPYAMIVINEDRCKRIALCSVCPPDVIKNGDPPEPKGFYHANLIGERCTGCKACALICPDICIESTSEAGSKAMKVLMKGTRRSAGRDPLRLHAVLRLPDHASERDTRVHCRAGCRPSGRRIPFRRRPKVAAPSTWSTRAVSTGGRAFTSSYVAGHQPDDGGDVLSGRRRVAVPGDQPDARRSWPGQHQPGAGRLLPGDPKEGPRLLPGDRAGAASVQEMADLTVLGLDLADKYRNPVMMLATATSAR